jgi:hypothetical protein
MSKVHPSRRHQPGQDAKRFSFALSIEDALEVTVSEDDASAVKAGGVWKVQTFHPVKPKAGDDALIVGGLGAAPWVNLHTSTSSCGGTRRG